MSVSLILALVAVSLSAEDVLPGRVEILKARVVLSAAVVAADAALRQLQIARAELDEASRVMAAEKKKACGEGDIGYARDGEPHCVPDKSK